MDELQKYIKRFNENCGSQLVEKLITDLKNEEFDTESIKMDLNLENNSNKDYDGNININNYGKILCKVVKQFVQSQKSYVLKSYVVEVVTQNKSKTKHKQKQKTNYKVNANSFSIGLCFYYWDYYKNLKEFDQNNVFNIKNIRNSSPNQSPSLSYI